jgi:hypothetical protein
MDDIKYSLNDIFGLLREATLILDRPITVITEEEDGEQKKTGMLLSEFVAMSLAHELVDESSRMASESTTASKKDVISAMKANYYEEVAFPNYEHFGVILGGGGRKTRKTAKRRYH